MAKRDSFITSLKNKQLTKTVYDKNDQPVIEEGAILSSAEFLILKSRDISLENIDVQTPLALAKRNDFYKKLDGELLLEMDYPGKLGITAQPGTQIDTKVISDLSKLRICPSYYLKRTFRGAPFDVCAPMKNPGDFHVVLPAKGKFTAGILSSLLNSGFNLFDLIPKQSMKYKILLKNGEKVLIPARTKITGRHITKLKYAAIGGTPPYTGSKKTCKETVITDDYRVLTFKGEKVTDSLLSRIHEESLRAIEPDIFTLLEGTATDVPIVRIARKREELRPMDLLKMYSCPDFDFPLFYRNLGEEQLSHWFDPFIKIILKGFEGGRIVQKSGSVFDPNNPLRKYHGFIKIKLTDSGIVNTGEQQKSSPYRKIRDLTNPGTSKELTAKQKTKIAGGRYVALMCIIEHKRKVPTIFYHTTLAQDIPRIKDILNKVSRKLNLEAGLRIQEGHLL